MKRVFFGSSDAGGANVIAAVIRRLSPDAPFRLFTDIDGYRVAALQTRYEVLGDASAVARAFQSDLPDVVFTGTSLASEVERSLHAEARRRGIPCAAVVDHWTDFVKRFTGPREGPLFPDVVFVIDETASRMAIADGIPASIVRVFGHPHFHDAQFHLPAASRERFWGQAGVRSDRDVVLFLSDSLTETAGGAAEAERRFGYTETGILERILSSLASDADLSIVIRPHPRELPGKFSRYLQDQRLSVLGQPPLWDLLAHSDRVIGMFSSALLEAVAIGRQPLRVEVGAGERNLLPVPDCLFFDRVLDAGALAPVLERYLMSAESARRASVLPDAFASAIPEWLH